MRKLSRMRKDKGHKESFVNSLPVFLLVHQLLADYRFVPTRRAVLAFGIAALASLYFRQDHSTIPGDPLLLPGISRQVF